MSTNSPYSDFQGTLAISGSLDHLRLKRATITVIAGSNQGAQLVVGANPCFIGCSKECDLVLDDGFVSRKHIEVTPKESGVIVKDLASRNGLFMGSVGIGEICVTESATLTLGKTTLLVSIEGEELDIPLSKASHFGKALGISVAMRAVFALLEHAAQTDVTVLFEGESGTGKDILATSLHQKSRRAEGPFVVVDCGSIPENLIESELFGHEKGAFTGATGTRQGAFEQADGGTLFLDEIGELPLELQPRLLRALETRSFRRVGGSRTISTDARFIAATNRRLAEAVRSGQFREDLYYRLNVVQVRVPPLAERPEDVPLLAEQFLKRSLRDEDAEMPVDLARVLASHTWPGNARELRNVVERFATFGSTNPRLLFGSTGLVESPETEPNEGSTHLALSGLLDLDYHEAKRRVIDQLHLTLLPHVVEASGNNISEAAKKLGLPRTSLHRMLKKLDL